MLSLLKKKSDAAAPQVAPWHPNFRNYEKLPDIKVVRTAFFINGAAIFLALGLLTYFGIKEWQLRVLRSQIVAAEQQIATNKPQSDQAVTLFRRFQAEEAKVNEVDAFLKSKPRVTDLLLHLGRTIPENIAIDSFDLRDTGLVLRLSIRGTPDAALGEANDYLEQLKADKTLGERFEPAEMTSATLNPSSGMMAVEINQRLKGAKK